MTPGVTFRRLQPIEVAVRLHHLLVRCAPADARAPIVLDPLTPHGQWLVAACRDLLDWLGETAIITQRGELWVPVDSRCPDDVPA